MTTLTQRIPDDTLDRERIRATPTERPLRLPLRLDMNEGVLSEEEARELLAPLRLAAPDAISRYPDDRDLVERYAAYLGRAPSGILATAGADDAIDRIMRRLRGERVVLTKPTFGVLAERALRVGAELEEVPWEWGSFPVDRFIERARGAACAIIVSPNNPTGLSISPESLRAVRAGLPGTLLVVDAAYEEFSRAPLTDTALDLPNTLVLRTLSKAWALAGLRIGFVLGPAEEISALRAIAPPFPIARTSLVVAERAIATQAEAMGRRVERVRAARQRLARRLAELSVLEASDGEVAAVTTSDANFVLFRHEECEAIAGRLASLDVFVRRWSEPGLHDAMRITVTGDAERDERALASIEAAIRPAALLLDMDGVLVDVGASYREAIRMTAASYGVRLAPDEIAEAKRAGDANNDWVLTARLLARRGLAPPLDEIIERFDRLYLGDEAEGRVGLASAERTLVDPALLRAIAARMPVGIVTGRPLRDARAWLDRTRLSDAIGCLVTMEDAPAKPSPEPVELALARLGVGTAWFVGDTVDDMRSARRAQQPVVPIGVIAPAAGRAAEDASADAMANEAALRAAGAATVERDINSMLAMCRRACGGGGSWR